MNPVPRQVSECDVAAVKECFNTHFEPCGESPQSVDKITCPCTGQLPPHFIRIGQPTLTGLDDNSWHNNSFMPVLNEWDPHLYLRTCPRHYKKNVTEILATIAGVVVREKGMSSTMCANNQFKERSFQKNDVIFGWKRNAQQVSPRAETSVAVVGVEAAAPASESAIVAEEIAVTPLPPQLVQVMAPESVPPQGDASAAPPSEEEAALLKQAAAEAVALLKDAACKAGSSRANELRAMRLCDAISSAVKDAASSFVPNENLDGPNARCNVRCYTYRPTLSVQQFEFRITPHDTVADLVRQMLEGNRLECLRGLEYGTDFRFIYAGKTIPLGSIIRLATMKWQQFDLHLFVGIPRSSSNSSNSEEEEEEEEEKEEEEGEEEGAVEAEKEEQSEVIVHQEAGGEGGGEEEVGEEWTESECEYYHQWSESEWAEYNKWENCSEECSEEEVCVWNGRKERKLMLNEEAEE